MPLPLTSSESDVSRDELPSPEPTPLRSSSRKPLAVLGLHGSSESRRRPSHTPPCASSSACAARVPWSLEPEPPPSRRRMPPAILPPRRSPPPPPLSPFDPLGRWRARSRRRRPRRRAYRAVPRRPRPSARRTSLSPCPRGRVACSGAPRAASPVLSTFSQVGAERSSGESSSAGQKRCPRVIMSRFTFGAREARWRKLARPRTFWSAGADSRYDVPTRARGIARSVRLRGRAATRGADL